MKALLSTHSWWHTLYYQRNSRRYHQNKHDYFLKRKTHSVQHVVAHFCSLCTISYMYLHHWKPSLHIEAYVKVRFSFLCHKWEKYQLKSLSLRWSQFRGRPGEAGGWGRGAFSRWHFRKLPNLSRSYINSHLRCNKPQSRTLRTNWAKKWGYIIFTKQLRIFIDTQIDLQFFAIYTGLCNMESNQMPLHPPSIIL